MSRGFNRIPDIIAQLREDRNRKVHVGILDGATNSDGDLIAQYAAYNEYGTEQIPERPFLRMAADSSMQELGDVAARTMSRTFDGRLTLEAIGNRLAYNVRKVIDSRVPPPNAMSTVLRKGFDHPLIETKALRGAIKYEVRR